MRATMHWRDVTALNGSLIDVSLPVRPGMFPVSEQSNVRFVVINGYDSPLGMYETQLRMSCHAGTHVDYSSHIDPDGYRAFRDDGFEDVLFPEHTFTLAYFLPFDGKRPSGLLPAGEWQWGEEITEAEVRAWFERFDAAHPGFPHQEVKGVLLRTGWNDQWFHPDFWRRGGPTLSDSAARHFMDRGLHYLSADFTFTFEVGRTHDIVLRHPDGNRFLVESLCNLGAIRTELVGLFVAPLKLEGCEGLPARVYVVEVEPSPSS
ncbi:MAG TPA: hypothetical protein DEP84_27580 [Chloroflexi bacterium]|nr:hypothetical protein [Chloroflexota bacterium]